MQTEPSGGPRLGGTQAPGPQRKTGFSGQRLAIASRMAGTTFAQRFSVVSLMLSPGGTR